MHELIWRPTYFVTGPAPQKRNYDCDIEYTYHYISISTIGSLAVVVLIIVCIGHRDKKILTSVVPFFTSLKQQFQKISKLLIS